MPKSYNTEILEESNTVKACVTNAKVSFKNTRETCSTLRGRSVEGCITYLNNVLEKKECVPMRRYANKVGNTKQAKQFMHGQFPCTKGRWPKNSVEAMLKLMKNIKNNAACKSINVDDLVIKMVSVNRAPKIHGRVFRAHGRVNAFNKSPCHIQVVCVKQPISVAQDANLVEVDE
ncbi:large subunit ribosomal protein L17e [Enteropsectra breve]|nr:large subunit ribosomal protein L17e [Enteropsectra breve]